MTLLRISAIVLTVLPLCLPAYGRTQAVLFADTPVEVSIVHPVSSSDRVGDRVEFRIQDAICIGSFILAPRGTIVTGRIAKIYPSLFGRPRQIEIEFDPIHMLSGENISLRDIRITLIGGNVPAGTPSTLHTGKNVTFSGQDLIRLSVLG